MEINQPYSYIPLDPARILSVLTNGNPCQKSSMSVIAKLPVAGPAKKRGTDDVEDLQRYVRVTKIDNRGYVEFQFSVGDPNLYLEMTLPRAAYDEFFAREQAIHLTDEQARGVDETEKKWRFGDFAGEED